MTEKLKSKAVAVGLGLSIVIIGLVIPSITHEGISRKETAMAEGARQVTIQLKVAGNTVTLNVVCFRQDKCRMRVVANALPSPNRRVAGIAQDHHAIAGCNGGYFALSTLMPSGLEIAEGIASGTFSDTGPVGALFGIRDDQPFIDYEKEFQPSPDVSGLVQCSPMLVNEDWTFHVNGETDAARTFVMTDGSGQWAIGAIDPVSLNDLATLLTRSGLIPGFHVRRAMNLDGGPSTGFWWQGQDGTAHEQRERWRVRNVVLIEPR